jgi:hypothetical protein
MKPGFVGAILPTHGGDRGLAFMGEPIAKLSREELIAVANYLVDRDALREAERRNNIATILGLKSQLRRRWWHGWF